MLDIPDELFERCLRALHHAPADKPSMALLLDMHGAPEGLKAALALAYDAGARPWKTTLALLVEQVRELAKTLPLECPYHGRDFDKLGMLYGLPRCDSCKKPYQVARLLEAVNANV